MDCWSCIRRYDEIVYLNSSFFKRYHERELLCFLCFKWVNWGTKKFSGMFPITSWEYGLDMSTRSTILSRPICSVIRMCGSLACLSCPDSPARSCIRWLHILHIAHQCSPEEDKELMTIKWPSPFCQISEVWRHTPTRKNVKTRAALILTGAWLLLWIVKTKLKILKPIPKTTALACVCVWQKEDTATEELSKLRAPLAQAALPHNHA